MFLTARASESLEELRQSLSGHKLSGASPEAKSQLSDVVNPRHLAYAEAAYYLKQHLEKQKVRFSDFIFWFPEGKWRGKSWVFTAFPLAYICIFLCVSQAGLMSKAEQYK